MSVKLVDISYQDVLSYIKFLSGIDLQTTWYSPYLITKALEDLRHLKNQYDSGEIRYDDSWREKLRAGSLGNASQFQVNQTQQLGDTLVATPDQTIKKAHLPHEFKQAASISISKMDWEALQRVIPMGSITPATPGEFYVAQELKLPIHCGFVRNITHSEQPLAARQLVPIPGAVPHGRDDSSGVKIEFQHGMTRLIPVPVGCAIRSIGSESSSVLAPKPTDPLVWQNKDYFDNIAYAIKADASPAYTTVDLKAFYPSEKEQAYFRHKMPLPVDLQAEILRSPEDTLGLIAGYLAKRTPTGGTNFRYVLNPHLSDFLQANKDYLTLIVHELKVGHCDLLAWYAAAQLRAYGRPAWVASGLVTTPDGSSFNAAYGHSVVITADKHGKLIQYDPTVTVEIDVGYHPAVLEAGDIGKLDSDFSRARSVVQKQAVLRSFCKLIEDKRAQASSNPRVTKDLFSVRASVLPSLVDTTDALANQSHKFMGQSVSWGALPSSAGVAEVRRVMLELVTDPRRILDVAGTYVGIDHLGSTTRTQREHQQWLLRVLREYKFQLSVDYAPISEVSLQGCFSLADYYGSKNKQNRLWINTSNLSRLTSENVTSILSVLDKRLDEYSCSAIPTFNLQSIELENKEIPADFTRIIKQASAKHTLCSLLHSSDDFERGNDRSDRRIALNLQRNEIAYFSIYFMVKIQQALLNSTKRQSFLSEFKSDETLLRDFVVQSLHLHSNKTKRLTHERITSAERVKNQAFYLHPDDIQRLERNVMRAIAGIDIRQTTGVTREDTQTRPYSPGDDTRKINWKVWARTDKFHVNSSPDTIQGISSPIYVILGTLDRVSSALISKSDFYEQHYITALQKEMKRSGREFFVGILRGDAYVKLHHNSNPRAFLDALYKRHGSGAPHPFRITSKSGPRNSGNFLVISQDFTEIACLHYLASKQPRTRLHYIHTKEPEYRVYPLRKDEWVAKGDDFFSED